MLVSHDRYLIEAVATDVWAVVDGRVWDLSGGWEAFLQWRASYRRESAEANRQATEQSGGRPQPPAQERRTRKPSNRERQAMHRHEKIEDEIEALEGELAAMMEQVSAAGEAADMARVEELSRTYQQRDGHLEEATWAEWERLGEQLG